MLLRTAFNLASPAGERGRLSILIFHRVLPQPDPLFPGEVDVARFDELMGWVREWFNVLPLADAVARLRSGALPPRAAAITFDDGYADNLTQAVPVLQKHGLHATFFIATGFVDGGRMWNDTIIESVRGSAEAVLDARFLGLGELALGGVESRRAALAALIPAIKHKPAEQRAAAVTQVAAACGAALPDDLMLSSAQLRALRDAGMGIGAHTVSHPILATLDEAAARREMADSRDRLQGLLGERIGLFAYPNGKLGADYGAAHAALARELGFDAAVSTNPGACTRASDPYQLPRFSPWDRSAWRYGLRMLANLRRADVALGGEAA